MRRVAVFLVSMFIGLLLGHVLIGRPLADLITNTFKKHQRYIDQKIKEFEDDSQ